MILTVFAQVMPIGSSSGFFHKIFGHVKIFLITSNFIKLCKSHFYNRMTRRTMNLPSIRTKNLTNQIGIFNGYIQ